MKKLTSRLVRICLRVGIICALCTAILFSSELQLSGNKMQAIATPTSETKSYEIPLDARQPTSEIEKDARSAVDNIREKLNLDQPIAPSTKKFIKSVKTNLEEAVTPPPKAVEKATD